MSIELKFNHKKLNLADWFDLDDALDRLVAKYATEGLRNTFRDYQPQIEFGWRYKDRGKLNVHLCLGSGADDGWIYITVDIGEMVDDFIKLSARDFMDGGDKAKIDLAKCLRKAADKLEKAAS